MILAALSKLSLRGAVWLAATAGCLGVWWGVARLVRHALA